MGTLAGHKVKEKYGNLLHVEGGITGTLKTVEDGVGQASPLKLSTTEVAFTSAPTTDNSEATALLVNSSNEIVKRELDAIAFDGQTFPETIIAAVDVDLNFVGGSTNTLTYATVDNATDGSSFHLYSKTADLSLDNSTGEITTSSESLVKVSGSFRVVASANGTNITYVLQKSTDEGVSWSNYSTVNVIKSTGHATAIQIHSFFATFLVEASAVYRIRITTSDDIVVKPGTQVEFNKRLPQ